MAALSLRRSAQIGYYWYQIHISRRLNLPYQGLKSKVSIAENRSHSRSFHSN